MRHYTDSFYFGIIVKFCCPRVVRYLPRQLRRRWSAQKEENTPNGHLCIWMPLLSSEFQLIIHSATDDSLQIYFDAVPFRESNQFQIMMHLVVGKRPERLETQRMEDDEWNLIQSCWHSIRSERPSVRDIVKTMTSIVHAGDDKRTDWDNN